MQLRKMLTASPETLEELDSASSLDPALGLGLLSASVLELWSSSLHAGPSFEDISHLSQHDLLLLELSVLIAKSQMNFLWPFYP